MIGPRPERNVVRCSAAVCGGGAQGVVTTKTAARRLDESPRYSDQMRVRHQTLLNSAVFGNVPLAKLFSIRHSWRSTMETETESRSGANFRRKISESEFPEKTFWRELDASDKMAANKAGYWNVRPGKLTSVSISEGIRQYLLKDDSSRTTECFVKPGYAVII